MPDPSEPAPAHTVLRLRRSIPDTSRRYDIDGRSFAARFPEGSEEARGEADLSRNGIVVPADHRIEWSLAWGHGGRVVEVWSPDQARCACVMVIDVAASRALPGHELWRVDRLGGYAETAALEAAISAISEAAQLRPRVVGVYLGIASRDPEVLARLRARARELGYVRSREPRHYERTSCIDLGDPVEAILGRASGSCRRAIRAVEKNPIEVRTILDPTRGPELGALLRETMRRTEGPTGAPRSWSDVIGYARRHPDSARVVGMFSSEGKGERLVAFALGLRQGDHVEYRAAASTRAGVRAPVGYALVWDLIEWGKQTGAQWFDFGGRPTGDVPEELRGIVRFKESFGGTEIPFREEWLLEPRPFLGSARRGISTAARRLGRLLRRS